jgi:hypothetical protein
MSLTAADWAVYGPDWGDVAWQVKEAAGWRCQCTGECGRGHLHLDPGDGRCRNRHGEPRWRGKPWQGPVFLQAAHLDHDPTSHDRDRLRAMCPGCHLRLDAAHNAAMRRERLAAELGMIPLF